MGKLAILTAFLLLVTWAPAMMLLLVQMLFAGSTTFIRNNLFVVPAVTLFSLIHVLLSGMTMLALSSLSRSSRFAAIMYAGLIFFTKALAEMVHAMTGRSMLAWLSPTSALEQVGDIIFRLRPRHEMSPLAAVVVLIALVAVSVVVLERRVRGVEIVT